jgi:hypothetical protein
MGAVSTQYVAEHETKEEVKCQKAHQQVQVDRQVRHRQ